ncbi:MAG TPA: sensor histidine kinase, partial [Flavisolibacter sp.]|nr:sensor histidine kinase [Flavisolibacter sp.]
MNNTALCHQRSGDDETAIELFKAQIEIAKKINRKRSIVRALINLATSYYALVNKTELEKTSTELNAFFRDNPKTDIKLKCFQYIVNAYNNILDNDFKKAENYLLEGLQIAENDALVDPLLIMYNTLATVKAAQYDFKSVGMYGLKSDSLVQTLHERDLSEYALDLETRYETEKKDNQLKLQQARIRQKDFLNYLFAGGTIALLLISILSYRNYKHKQKWQHQRISELETEKQLTAMEAVLKGEEQERTRLAKDLHDGLGGMMSGIKYSLQTMKKNVIMTPENQQAFERSIDMLDSSINEMRRVAHNMMPEALVKFGLDTALKDLCSEVNQTGALQVNYQSIGMDHALIDQTTAITIYRIVQELINNTMKHAAATNSIVQLSKTDDKLTITVEDDGKGFDTACLHMAKGIGWTNIMNRVEFLKGKLDIHSHPGK